MGRTLLPNRPSFGSVLKHLTGMSPEELDDAELVAALKCEAQLETMIAGALGQGEHGAARFLSLCLFLKALKEVKRGN